MNSDPPEMDQISLARPNQIKKRTRSKTDEIKPLAVWKGSDRIQEAFVDTLTIILKSNGCSWNGCRMCSYRHERYAPTQSQSLTEHMLAQLLYVAQNYDYANCPVIKIYTSGSFFDEQEVPVRVREEVAKQFDAKTLIVESRAEYADAEIISGFCESLNADDPLYVAIGLETSNDAIRNRSIHKGFSFDEYKKATKRVHNAGARVKTYLLQKPAFLTEQEALTDMHRSIADVMPYTDLISLNPCTVQKNTELERLWKQGSYRPPYLWSVLDVLIQAPVHVSCDPLGGGKRRGASNCSVCSKMIVDGIYDYSLTSDRELLYSLAEMPCNCKEVWEFVLAEERSYNMPLS
jgi:radical SAM enzyme (TIGR01210 family)